jgi:hypothetical protein
MSRKRNTAIKRGVLTDGTGAIDGIVVQKNQRIRVRKETVKKRKRQ